MVGMGAVTGIGVPTSEIEVGFTSVKYERLTMIPTDEMIRTILIGVER